MGSMDSDLLLILVFRKHSYINSTSMRSYALWMRVGSRDCKLDHNHVSAEVSVMLLQPLLLLFMKRHIIILTSSLETASSVRSSSFLPALEMSARLTLSLQWLEFVRF